MKKDQKSTYLFFICRLRSDFRQTVLFLRYGRLKEVIDFTTSQRIKRVAITLAPPCDIN